MTALFLNTLFRPYAHLCAPCSCLVGVFQQINTPYYYYDKEIL